ncbi:MAG: hypothetical protein HQ582_13645, partial [Planctomycetes bacterium]|nr:hypothetical protein [Planctomycetota bacterium]
MDAMTGFDGKRLATAWAFVLALALGSTAAAQTLTVDVGHASTSTSSGDVQPGFFDLSAANLDDRLMGRAEETFSGSFSSPLGVEGTVGVALGAPHSRWKTLAFRDRGDMSGELADLAEDFAFNEARLKLTLSRLKPGVYAMTTWHHDPSYAGGMIDVVVGSRTVRGAVVQTTGRSTAPASAEFTFTANGTDPVVIGFVSQSQSDAFVAYLNGFSLAPAGVLAEFDVDLTRDPITQATGGPGGGPLASLRLADADTPARASSSAEDGIRMSVAGASGDACHDQGIDGPLAHHPQSALLRDFVGVESSAVEKEDGRLTVVVEGLQPGAGYLITWYAYEETSEPGRPMFIYRDRVDEKALLFTNVERFLYTKENALRGGASPDDSASTLLATADEKGEIRLVSGRGASVGSD